HHTASAILAEEAFDAAADPKRFPEQLKYTQVWQTKRIFWNTFNFGGTNTTAPNQLQVDVGVFNPLTGKSYGEVAAESRSNHKSQGFGSAKTRGSAIEYFKLIKGDSAKADLFEGIDQSWNRLGASKIKAQLEESIMRFSFQNPEKSIADLTAVYKLLQTLDEKKAEIGYWKKLKIKEAENLLLSCSGLWCEASAADYIGIPGSPADITAQLVNRNKSEVKLSKITFFGQTDTVLSVNPKQNELLSYKHKELIPVQMNFSNPYWLNEKHGVGRYTVSDRLLIGKPENEAPAKVVFAIELNGLALNIERALVYKSTDPVKGEIYRPFEILPPATINLSEKMYVFGDAGPKTFQLIIKANAGNISGTIESKVPEGWILNLEKKTFSFTNKGEELIVNGSLLPGKESKEGKLEVSLKINNTTYNKSIKRIDYDHIPSQFILSTAEADLVKIDLKKTGTRIAYIPGAGDEVMECMKQVGYDITLLTDDLLAAGDLTKYTAIVTGVRAYNTNEKLQNYYSRLMDYVSQGGNLVVQYNTNNRIGPLLAKIGPYPFTISRDRVTDEHAEM
ncbi:MAG: LmbE family protein, partial [Bacteroidota bacterium]